MPLIELDGLLAALRVTPHGDDRYAAPHVPMAYRRIFGGQLLAQCIVVAAATAPGRTVRSLHAAFPREGDLGEPLTYRVERFQDGRTFAGRSVVGEQEGREVVVAHLSLHVAEAGPEHAWPMPGVPGPEDCPAVELSMIPWTTRVVDGVDLAARDVGPPRYAFWMRAPSPGDDPAVHAALLAHATDLTLIGTALRPFAGLGEADAPARVQTAVTGHDLWLHAPLRMDDWLLVHQESPRAGGGRGFGLGHVWTRDGVLVASFAQESLIRPVA